MIICRGIQPWTSSADALHSVGPIPVNVIRCQCCSQGLRTVREIEQSDGVLRLCEMVIRIRDVSGAQEAESVRVVGAANEAESVRQFVQGSGHKIVGAHGRVAIGSEVPIGCAVECALEVGLFREVFAGKCVGQSSGIVRVADGRIGKILVEVRRPCLRQRTSTQIRPKCIDAHRHIRGQQHRPNVHGVVESQHGLFGKPVVVHNHGGVPGGIWCVPRGRSNVGVGVHRNAFEAGSARGVLVAAGRSGRQATDALSHTGVYHRHAQGQAQGPAESAQV